MKAGILENVECLTVKEVHGPKLEEGAVIVKVKVCSICSTDLRIYHHGHPRVKLPHILGHEIAGEIEAVGQGVKCYQPGDRVAITPRIACGRCFYCRRGEHIYCLDSMSFGYQLPGGFAERLLVPRSGVEFGVVNKIADTVSFEEAALAEILACCLRAQKSCKVRAGETVVVIGGGTVGIIHCRLAKANNAANVILIEKETKRLEKIDLSSVDEIVDANKNNTEIMTLGYHGSIKADVVIVACSSTEAQELSLSLAGKGGRISFFGGLPINQSKILLDSNLIHYNEISVHGSHGSLPEDNQEALNKLAGSEVKVSDLMTHMFPLDSIGEAFNFAESRQGMHIAVSP